MSLLIIEFKKNVTIIEYGKLHLPTWVAIVQLLSWEKTNGFSYR